MEGDMPYNYYDEQVRKATNGTTQADVNAAGTGQYGQNADQPDHVKQYLEGAQKAVRMFTPPSPPAYVPGPSVYPRSGHPAKPAKSAPAASPDSPPVRYGAKLMAGLLCLAVLGIAGLIGTGIATTPDTAGINAAALSHGQIDPRTYSSPSPAVAQLAQIPSSTLYDRQLKGKLAYWANMEQPQRDAVMASWQRYMQDPKSFLALEPILQDSFLALFDTYLLALGQSTGQAQPLIDRGRLYLSGLDSKESLELARSKWGEGALLLPRDASLAALADDHTLSGRTQAWIARGLNTWRMLLD
jgi:hypothetical protein